MMPATLKSSFILIHFDERITAVHASMEFIRNNKGGIKLCYSGFMYTRRSSNATCRRWECSQRKAMHCNGKITTGLENENVIDIVEHNNHFADNGNIEAAKLKLAFKENAIHYRGKTDVSRWCCVC